MNFNNLQKLNKIRLINDILFAMYDVISDAKATIEDSIDELDDYELSDELMTELINRIKYDVDTLRRYL